MILVILAATVSLAEECEKTNTELVVALDESPPFSYKDVTGRWTGISVDLWEKTAQELGLTYSYVEKEFSQSLALLSDCTYDVVLPAVTVTSDRELLFDFTHSYMAEDVAVATSKTLSPVQRSLILFQEMFPYLAGIGLLVALAAWGYVIIEKGHKHAEPCQDLLDSIYWALTTTSTVGYGDEAPKTLGGKILAMGWMVTSMLVVSTFTAKLVLELQETHGIPQVDHLSDLKGESVGTVAGTFSEALLNQYGVHHRGYATETAMGVGLTSGEVDYIVYDRTMLSFLARGTDITVLAEKHYEQKLAFAVRDNLPVLEDLNREILSLTQTDWWRGTTFRHTHGE